ncbi:MAG TPA: chorismate mutase [Thermoanaerobaculia bacterium]|nr:chorismate mutase [Thermoanaerobaculia bacterium]
MSSTSDPLSGLRDSIAEVDRALLELLRRRMDLAAEVGRVKAASNIPVVVRDVEDRVLTRARQHAESCGVSEEVMAGVFQAILSGSVERQYRVGIALREQRGGRVLIVGGAGGMGNWFRGFLELAGHGVDLADPSLTSLPASAGRYSRLAEVPDLDVYMAVLVAVPLSRTPQVLEEVVARSPRGLVVEIASIKDPLSGVIARARERGVKAHALHPMFGPGKSFYEPLTFVLAACGDPAAEKHDLSPLLSHPYTRLVAVPFSHHDRLMGWLLGLAHLTNMLFGSALTRSGIDPEELRDCASTTFTRQATTALSVLAEDPDLYLDIQHLNPHRHEVYAAMREALEQLERLVEGREREGFRDTLAAARRALTEE